MEFPTEQRHASARYGAAIELVQQEPFSIGVELAACATKAMMLVGVKVETLELEVFATGADVGTLDDVKNCPTPNRITRRTTTARRILLVLFI